MSVGQFNKRVEKETRHLLQANGEAIETTIAASDISSLPKPVANWLGQCGALGKPFIHVAKLTQSLAMQMKPGQQKWLPGQALQYTTINKPGFVWSVRVRMNRLLHFVGRDKFENGRGEMLIRLNGWLKIVHAKGPRIDEGALQRYLGEMVWFPSQALSPYISWKSIDDTSAEATLSYQGTTGSGRFHFTTQGDVTRYTALRYKDNTPKAQHYPWIMEIDDYKVFEGIRVPSRLRSTWKLEEGDWTWLKMELTDLAYNTAVLQR